MGEREVEKKRPTGKYTGRLQAQTDTKGRGRGKETGKKKKTNNRHI